MRILCVWTPFLILFLTSINVSAQSRVPIGSGFECEVRSEGNSIYKENGSNPITFKGVKGRLVRQLVRLSQNPVRNRDKIGQLKTTLRNLRLCQQQSGAFSPNQGEATPTPIAPPESSTSIIAAHEAVAAYSNVPESVKNSIQDSFRIFYGHTSHGSQILTGIQMLANSSSPPIIGIFDEEGSDLGHYGDTSWVSITRNWLGTHPQTNLVMWSWCGGVSDNTPSGIDAYLHAMNRLEEQYPNVKFVYMTGHLDGTGDDGTLRELNRRIREYCVRNNKILFDFEDIESFDPDGNYYPNASDTCEWCGRWCSTHSCPSSSLCRGEDDCAHSDCFNCYRKARAWWWMMARLAGWEG